MTKRFENVEIDKKYCLICLNDNIRFRSLSEEGLEDLLNVLNDDNEQLKSNLEFWMKQAKHCPIRKGEMWND